MGDVPLEDTDRLDNYLRFKMLTCTHWYFELIGMF